jgi:hypothetical protein
LFKPTGCYTKREIFRNKLGKKISKTLPKKLSHGVNNPMQWFYDDKNHDKQGTVND